MLRFSCRNVNRPVSPVMFFYPANGIEKTLKNDAASVVSFGEGLPFGSP
ncbi:MAG TPA: hypothetical protein PLP19_05865 [bacterium]|nr:hypothetical protein [bacterium]HPN42994.1 hypothetical protein [bacterium]